MSASELFQAGDQTHSVYENRGIPSRMAFLQATQNRLHVRLVVRVDL